MGRLKKFLPAVLAFCLAVLCLLAMGFPLPEALAKGEAQIVCRWEDGSVSALTHAGALPLLRGIGEEGDILLSDGNRQGRVETSAAMRTACAVLSGGSLADMVALDTAALGSFERTALFCAYAQTVWYAGEAFGFDGRRVVPKTAESAAAVVLLQGNLPAGFLSSVRAEKLHIFGGAELSASALTGSHVAQVTAEAPYCFYDGGIYLDTPGGRRLVAALPDLTELTVSGCQFADRGALLPCAKLQMLTIPFAGSSLSGAESGASGEFGWLFRTSSGDTMPETLTSVTVSGGKLTAYCFYGADCLETIDACKVAPEDIERQAFLGAPDLRFVHSPRSDIFLGEGFSSRTAECGCTVFERAQG